MADTRPTILILLGCFSRGVEATGPNQSLLGMVHALSDRYRFRVMAETAPGEEPGRWTQISGVDQLPLGKAMIGSRDLARAINDTPHALLITNGFFDRRFTLPMLVMRRLGLIPRRPVLLAPRGEFSPGALDLSRGRKRAYIAAARAFGLLRGVTLQATSEEEKKDIRRALPFAADIAVTPNIRPLSPLPLRPPRAENAPLRVAFLSRIDRKKNLLFALDRLEEAGVAAEFCIYGPVSDEAYWRRCEERIAALPPHLRVVHHGAIPQSEVAQALAAHDLFFLPTLGENFGHSIADALSAGTPVLISDQTPWRGLREAGAGWDIPLSDGPAFVAAIREAAAAKADAKREMNRCARAYVEKVLDPAAAAQALAQWLDHLMDAEYWLGREHAATEPGTDHGTA